MARLHWRQAKASSDFLYVWTGSADSTQRDFLAVFDVRPTSDRYGRLPITVMALLYSTLSVFPIIEVASWRVFALKIITPSSTELRGYSLNLLSGRLGRDTKSTVM